MNCVRVRPELPFLGTGELDPRREAEVLRHLDRCPPCREAEVEESALDSVLAQWRPSIPRRDIAPAVLAAAGRPLPAAEEKNILSLLPARRSALPLFAAAAVLAAVAVTALLFSGGASESGRGESLVATLGTTFGADSIPIGSGVTGLAFPARDPFRSR